MDTLLELHESDQKIIFSDDTFRLFQDLMRQKAGITLYDNGKEFVRSRLRDSVIEKQFSNFKDFYYYLKYDKNRETELFNVVDLLTIHETYFFREMLQLETFSDEGISEIMARNKSRKSMRIWSAGCSTGEEAYTLSMLVLEKPELRDWRCEILATDISPPVLHYARKGIYSQNSFRGMPDQFLEKYFTREDKGYRINPPVKEKVAFFHNNLIEPEKMFFLNEIDAIFCRNVIIYFDLEVKKKVIGTFHEKLKQNGFLFLGHSESLSYITTDFELRHFKKNMVYQKQSGSRS